MFSVFMIIVNAWRDIRPYMLITLLSEDLTVLHLFLLCLQDICEVKFSRYLRCQLITLDNNNNKKKRNLRFQIMQDYFWSFLCLWCPNHVGPTLTGCCHWSRYETVWLQLSQPSRWLVLSCIASNINSSEATHGWAVMYGSLFIFFHLFISSNPSCYIGRRQQTIRDISHQRERRISCNHTLSGGGFAFAQRGGE